MTIPYMETIGVDLNLHLAGWPRNSWGFDGDILGCETQLDYPKKKSHTISVKFIALVGCIKIKPSNHVV